MVIIIKLFVIIYLHLSLLKSIPWEAGITDHYVHNTVEARYLLHYCKQLAYDRYS